MLVRGSTRVITSSFRNIRCNKLLIPSVHILHYWHLSNLFDGPVADIKDRTDSYYYKKSQKFFRRFNEQGYLTGLSYDLCYQYTWRGPNLGIPGASKETLTFFCNFFEQGVGK